jgi:hypothetical protein
MSLTVKKTMLNQYLIFNSMAKKKIMKLSEMDALLDALDIEPILNNRVRRVKWLYNNGNKMRMVYDEKLVRLIVHRLQTRIKELENKTQ